MLSDFRNTRATLVVPSGLAPPIPACPLPSGRTDLPVSAEFAERLALNHLAVDDAYWDGLRALFGEDELADLTISCDMWLGMGRLLAVLGILAPEERILV